MPYMAFVVRALTFASVGIRGYIWLPYFLSHDDSVFGSLALLLFIYYIFDFSPNRMANLPVHYNFR